MARIRSRSQPIRSNLSINTLAISTSEASASGPEIDTPVRTNGSSSSYSFSATLSPLRQEVAREIASLRNVLVPRRVPGRRGLPHADAPKPAVLGLRDPDERLLRTRLGPGD